jgi:hypothetical protein
LVSPSNRTRRTFADVGHLLENTRLAALAQGIAVHPRLRFDEASWAEVLGVDPTQEGPMVVVELGSDSGVTELPGHWEAAASALAPGHPSGVTGQAYLATSLRWSPDAVMQRSRPAAAQRVPLATGAASEANVLATIRTRRSERSFAPEKLALSDLGTTLRLAQGPGPVLSDAVETYTTHACNLRVRQASIGPRSARNNLLVLSTHRRPKRSLAKCAGSRRSWYMWLPTGSTG